MNKVRDQHPRYDRHRHDKKLLDGLFKRQPGKDHKTDTQQQAHIIDDQPVPFGIDHPEKHHCGKKQDLLQHIEKKIFYVSRLEAYDKKT